MILPKCSPNRLHRLFLFAKVARDHESLARATGMHAQQQDGMRQSHVRLRC